VSQATIYPPAVANLLREAKTQRAIKPRLVILHTNGGKSSASPAALKIFQDRTDVNVECHFDIGLDGTVMQMMPINVQADCNLKANPFAVSIETQDHGSAGIDTDPWTDQQCAAIVALLRFLHVEWNIPLVRADRFDGSGVGAHRDHPEWSAGAHTCPGNARAAQVDDLIRRAAELPAEVPG
jgi:N-acetylmuramoyl-L-alanine amidase